MFLSFSLPKNMNKHILWQGLRKGEDSTPSQLPKMKRLRVNWIVMLKKRFVILRRKS